MNMKIAVCIKQVPDSWAEKKMAGQVLDRANVDAVLNDLDEYAVEEALRIVEANSPTKEAGEASGHSITLISMGPERATEAIRKGLSMGADNAILISDASLAGSDALATSLVLSEVIKKENYDLVICGTESTDARMSVVPAMIAARLSWAQLTFAGKVKVDLAGSAVEIERVTEFGNQVMGAKFPVILSVVEKINEPRYPSFKGIMSAKKKSITTMSITDTGVPASNVGASAAWSAVKDALPRPPRGAGVKLTDEGKGGEKLVEFLVEKRLA
jgi:electron transfer flavoprotein beta subunit